MLLRACEEVMVEGKKPETDPAVALISGRIGFASPVDTMSNESWLGLIEICNHGIDAEIKIKDDVVQ